MNTQNTLDRTHTLAAVGDKGKAADYTSNAQAEYARLVAQGERATVVLANAAYVALRSGHIGKDDSPETFEVWAERFPYRDKDGNLQTYKRARVSQFALAGEAFTRHEIDPESAMGRKILGGVGTKVREAIQHEYTRNAKPENGIAKAIKDAAKDSAELAAKRATNSSGNTWPRAKPTTDAQKIEALEFIVAGWKIEKPAKVAATLRDIAGSLLAIAEHGEVKAEELAETA